MLDGNSGSVVHVAENIGQPPQEGASLQGSMGWTARGGAGGGLAQLPCLCKISTDCTDCMLHPLHAVRTGKIESQGCWSQGAGGGVKDDAAGLGAGNSRQQGQHNQRLKGAMLEVE